MRLSDVDDRQHGLDVYSLRFMEKKGNAAVNGFMNTMRHISSSKARSRNLS
jgi:hypothetical protein